MIQCCEDIHDNIKIVYELLKIRINNDKNQIFINRNGDLMNHKHWWISF